MAVPITSCMSEPMMAISIMSQRSTRGTWKGQGTTSCLSPQHRVALDKLAQQLSASFTTQSQDERWIPNLSLFPPPHPCPSES